MFSVFYGPPEEMFPSEKQASYLNLNHKVTPKKHLLLMSMSFLNMFNIILKIRCM